MPAEQLHTLNPPFEAPASPSLESAELMVEQAYDATRLSHEEEQLAVAQEVVARTETQPGSAMELGFGRFQEAFPVTQEILQTAYAEPHPGEIISDTEDGAYMRLVAPHHALVAAYPLLAEVHAGRTLEYALDFRKTASGEWELYQQQLMIDWAWDEHYGNDAIESSSELVISDDLPTLKASEELAVTFAENADRSWHTTYNVRELADGSISFTMADFDYTYSPESIAAESNEANTQAMEFQYQILLSVWQDQGEQTITTARELADGVYSLTEKRIWYENGQILEQATSTDTDFETLKGMYKAGLLDYTTSNNGDGAGEPINFELPEELSSVEAFTELSEEFYGDDDDAVVMTPEASPEWAPSILSSIEYAESTVIGLVPGSFQSTVIHSHQEESWEETTSWFTTESPNKAAEESAELPDRHDQPVIHFQAVIKNDGTVTLPAGSARFVISAPQRNHGEETVDNPLPPTTAEATNPEPIPPKQRAIVMTQMSLESFLQSVPEPTGQTEAVGVVYQDEVPVTQTTTPVRWDLTEAEPLQGELSGELMMNLEDVYDVLPPSEAVPAVASIEEIETTEVIEYDNTVTLYQADSLSEVMDVAPFIHQPGSETESTPVETEVVHEVATAQEAIEIAETTTPAEKSGVFFTENSAPQEAPAQTYSAQETSKPTISIAPTFNKKPKASHRRTCSSSSSKTTASKTAPAATQQNDDASVTVTPTVAPATAQQNDASVTVTENRQNIRRTRSTERVQQAEVTTHLDQLITRNIRLSGTADLNSRQAAAVQLAARHYAAQHRQASGKAAELVTLKIVKSGPAIFLDHNGRRERVAV